MISRTGLPSRALLAVIDTYARAISGLGAQSVKLIVLPEKIAVVSPAWNGAVDERFEAVASATHATVVVGLDERGTERRNVARVFVAGGASPMTYVKRHLIPGLESSFVPGRSPRMLSDHTGIAICKDMDFPAMLREDAMARPTLFAVPAWDFGGDVWWHARVAILRGVENGFSVARSSKQGLLTVSDAYGRVPGRKRSGTEGMQILVGDLPRGPGHTLYRIFGDSFAWSCVVSVFGINRLCLHQATACAWR